MIVLVTATVTRNAVVAMAAHVRRTLRWRGFGKASAGVGSGERPIVARRRLRDHRGTLPGPRAAHRRTGPGQLA